MPELIDRIPTVATSPIAGAETERYLVYRAVVDLLNAAAADRGLLLILDDLHWADSASVGLLSHLLTTDPLERVVIVGTYRDTDVSADSELGGLLADAWAEPGVNRLCLAGLDRTEILELMENAAGASLGAAGHALGLALENETAGNPFLLGRDASELSAKPVPSTRPPTAPGRWAHRTTSVRSPCRTACTMWYAAASVG